MALRASSALACSFFARSLPPRCSNFFCSLSCSSRRSLLQILLLDLQILQLVRRLLQRLGLFGVLVRLLLAGVLLQIVLQLLDLLR
jgi:hypothetical protein